MLRRIYNCSSVGIIHQKSNPANVLLDVKTPGYPVLVYVGKGLLPGGNWVRPNAKDDLTPLGTYRREIGEELQFGNPVVDPEEMNELFGKGHLGHAPLPRNVTPKSGDEGRLANIVEAIRSHAQPFGAFIEMVDKSVFDTGNPKNVQGDYQGLCHVFSVPLFNNEWQLLVDLQQRYGNLSNEAQSVIISLAEIVAKNLHIGWGQDRILRQFFAYHYLPGSEKMPLMPGTKVERVHFEDSYDEVLEKYHIEKIPEGISRPAV